MSAHPTPSKKPLVQVVIATLAVLVLFFAATRLISAWIPAGSNEEAERAALRAKNLADLQLANKEALETYGWANREAGAVRVPIEVAMQMVIPELNARPPAPAYPIAAAPPEPVVDELATETAADAPAETPDEGAAPEAEPAATIEPGAPAPADTALDSEETSEPAY